VVVNKRSHKRAYANLLGVFERAEMDANDAEIVLGTPVLKPLAAVKAAELLDPSVADGVSLKTLGRPEIQPGEVQINPMSLRTGLYMQVKNMKAEAKLDFEMRVIRIELWGQHLDGGKGAFGPWREFEKFWDKYGVAPLLEVDGERGRIDFHKAKLFELVRNTPGNHWQLRTTVREAIETIPLGKGRWRFSVDFLWKEQVAGLLVVAELLEDKYKNKSVKLALT